MEVATKMNFYKEREETEKEVSPPRQRRRVVQPPTTPRQELKLKRTEPLKVTTYGRADRKNSKVDEDITKCWSQHYCWALVDSYFKEHGVVQQQIDSYNEFLNSWLPKVVRELPPIEIIGDECRYDIQFCGENVTITPPEYMEPDGNITKLHPNLARLRNLTYASSVHCRVQIIRKEEGKTAERLDKESQKMRLIAKIPVMVKSNCCMLKKATVEQLQQLGECPLDPGGYFIINGKERVVVAQERAAANTMFVFPRHSDSKNLLECEIRSTVENSSASAHAFWVLLVQPKKRQHAQKKLRKPKGIIGDAPLIKAKFPSLKTPIDIIILFQVLGFENDKQIIENIIPLDSSPKSQKEYSTLVTFLKRSFEVPRLASQFAAKTYLKELIKADMTEREHEELQYIDNMLTKEFLPHLGTEEKDCTKKGYFLCQMIRRLLLVHTKFRPFDDRDHLENKRYLFAGPMISQLFFRGVRMMHSEVKKYVENQRSRNKKFNTDLMDLALRPATASKFMSHCLSSGIWGDARKLGCRHYKAVSQELNRFTYAALVSSMRRINSPEDKLHLMVKPRLLHNTYFGVLCPCETPEGKSVGLVKNLALQALITVGFESKPVKTFLLEKCGVMELLATLKKDEGQVPKAVERAEPVEAERTLRYGRRRHRQIPEVPDKVQRQRRHVENLFSLTNVFVNGDWIGFHEHPEDLMIILRTERRSGNQRIIPFEASLAWNPAEREIDIRVDAGRLTRPLMVIENNQLKISLEHISKLNSQEDYSWKNLLKDGLIEMVDVRESETALIAMFPEKLPNFPAPEQKTDKYRLNYTHMEIHPSMIFGVCASVIPFANHNQSPRNVYQSGIAKQAMGVYATNYYSRMDTGSHVLFYPQIPLINTKCAKYTGFNELPAGINCVVAIATYGGYNQEDSVILNQSAIDRGLFRSMHYQTYQDKAERNAGKGDKDEQFHRPNMGTTMDLRLCSGFHAADRMLNYAQIDCDGISPPGVVLKNDDCVIGKTVKLPREVLASQLLGQAKKNARHRKKVNTNGLQMSRRDASTYLKKGSSENSIQPIFSQRKQRKVPEHTMTVVDKSLVTTTSDGLKLVKVRVRKMLRPQVGDKFASLHGQKGVCGMVYREEDLLFTKQGIIPDIVINPHGMPSRMTIGQMYEAIYGKAASLSGERYDGTSFDTRDREKIFKVLRENGFQKNGDEVMYCGLTGRKQEKQIFIGPTYYQGRWIAIWRMERDCIISHGTALFLMERLLGVSDSYQMPICDKCGYILYPRPVHSPATPYLQCHRCPKHRNTIDGASTITLPYACKLLFQELQSMNISVKVVPNKLILDKKMCRQPELSDYDFDEQDYVRPPEGAKIKAKGRRRADSGDSDSKRAITGKKPEKSLEDDSSGSEEETDSDDLPLSDDENDVLNENWGNGLYPTLSDDEE